MLWFRSSPELKQGQCVLIKVQFALRSQPAVCVINSVGDSCQTTLHILISRQGNFSLPPEIF